MNISKSFLTLTGRLLKRVLAPTSKQLIKKSVDHLKQEGYSEIRLSDFDGNQAIRYMKVWAL